MSTEVYYLTENPLPPPDTNWCIQTRGADGTLSFSFVSKSGTRIKSPRVILDGAVSGGSFSDCLRQSAAECLLLRRVCMGFRLPCLDGQGEELDGEFSGGEFSEALCTNWKWSDRPEFDLILYDDDASLAEKRRIAEASGIAILIDATKRTTP